jgi:class 3 adenylate cyclase
VEECGPCTPDDHERKPTVKFDMQAMDEPTIEEIVEDIIFREFGMYLPSGMQASTFNKEAPLDEELTATATGSFRSKARSPSWRTSKPFADPDASAATSLQVQLQPSQSSDNSEAAAQTPTASAPPRRPSASTPTASALATSPPGSGSTAVLGGGAGLAMADGGAAGTRSPEWPRWSGGSDVGIGRSGIPPGQKKYLDSRLARSNSANSVTMDRLVTECGLARSSTSSFLGNEVQGHFNRMRKKCNGAIKKLLKDRLFSGFYVFLTIYALIAIDLETIYGDKTSEVAISIVTTVVFVLFLLEFSLFSLAKPSYLGRLPFWLDLLAVCALIPDTYVYQHVLFPNSQPSLAQARVAARATRTFRINRVIRIVRVVSLVPRIADTFLRRSNTDQVRRVLHQKLQRVFMAVDIDVAGTVPRSTLNLCHNHIRGEENRRRGQRFTRSSTRNVTGFSQRGTASFGRLNGVTIPDSSDAVVDEPLETEAVDFETFEKELLQDELVCAYLRSSCQRQLKKGNNMANIGMRQLEDISMKVAVGVLTMIVVLNVLTPVEHDTALQNGLAFLDGEVEWKLASELFNSSVPEFVMDHIEVWMQNWPHKDFELVYLDLDKRVFCNEFQELGQRCDPLYLDSPRYWSERLSLTDIDEDMFSSQYRLRDLSFHFWPDFDSSLSEEELAGRISAVAVVYERTQRNEQSAKLLLTTTAAVLIIMLGFVSIARDMISLRRSLLQPLRNLADEMQSITQRQLAGVTTSFSYEQCAAEIRLIQTTFEGMKNAMKSWGKYVPWQVVQRLLQNGVKADIFVEELEVTLFFSDIASFTTIVEAMEPVDSMVLLSQYFSEMSKVIEQNEGIVLEFIGDAIFALFGAPVKNEEHASSAVRATLKMLHCLRAINTWSASHNMPELQIRCGVHTGTCLVGNIGLQSRIKYGVVGDNATIPPRLEELNKTYGTDNLFSAQTHSRLGMSSIVTRPVDTVYLRPRDEQPERVYQALGVGRRSAASGGGLKAAASLHSAALDLYLARNFAEAEEKFGLVGAKLKEVLDMDDKASLIMKERCREYLRQPPGPGWKGVWDGA